MLAWLSRYSLTILIGIGTALTVVLIPWITWFRPYARDFAGFEALNVLIRLVPGMAAIAAAEPDHRSRVVAALGTGLATGCAIAAVWLIASAGVTCGYTLPVAAVVAGLAAIGVSLIVWIGSWLTATLGWIGAIASLGVSFAGTVPAIHIVATAAMAQNACSLTY